MPKKERYEHLSLPKALEVLAEEGNISKDEKEMLFQIAGKISEEFSFIYISDIMKQHSVVITGLSDSTGSKLWKKMVDLIDEGQYEEAREFINENRPAWMHQCEAKIDQVSSRREKNSPIPGLSKVDAFDEICAILGLTDIPLGNGSSVPKLFYERVIKSLNLEKVKNSLDDPPKHKKALARFIVEQAGLDHEWSDNFFVSGSTITAQGLVLVLSAIKKLKH